MNRAQGVFLLTCVIALACGKTPEQLRQAKSAAAPPPDEASSAVAADSAPNLGTSEELSERSSASAARASTSNLPRESAPSAVVADADAADTIYAHGVVLPMTDAGDVAQALAVRQGKILAVGSDESVLRTRRGKATHVVDLAGKTVLPGFIDVHGNLARAARNWQMVQLQPPPVGGVQNIPQLLEAMRRGANAKAFGNWIVGTGYEVAAFAEKRHPTRSELDLVSAERPVVVVDATARVAVCNSVCLKFAGYDEKTKDMPGLQREPRSKVPTGLLQETALDYLLQIVPELTGDTALGALEQAQERYVARGLTTVAASAAEPSDLRLFASAAQHDKLRVDVVVSPLLRHLDAMSAELAAVPSDGDAHHLRRGGVTVVLDGSARHGSPWLSQPYATPLEGQKNTYQGAGRLSATELRSALERAKREHLQLRAQCDGDEAAEQLLRSMESVLGSDHEDRRWLLVHAQVLREEQLSRMKRLPLVPSFAASQVFYWSDAQRDALLGPERSENILPTHWAIEQNLRFSIHDDSPSVPPDPFLLLWAATNRITQGEQLLGPDQRLTTYEGLRALTIDAAYQAFEDDEKGSLEPGKRADLVIIAENPLTEPMSSLKSMEVVETIKDGRTVWEP